MPFFAVHYTYVDDTAALDAGRPEHRAYLGSLAEQGLLAASGPLLGTSPARALLLFRAESAAAVEDLLTKDPFQVKKLVAEHTVTGWDPVLGVFANDRD